MAPQGMVTPDGLVPWAVYRSRCVFLGHFHPGHQCGICGGVFQFNERCVGLLGNPDSTTCWLSTTPFLYPDYGLTIRAVDGWSLCRRPGCPQCAASPEAATLHLECFEAFRQAYAPVYALDRLWRAASWRRPWRSAPAVVLPERGAIGAVEAVAAKCGLQELSRMPPEIVHMVRGYSESALFWRLVAALDLAVQLKTGPPSSLISVALSQMSGWKRESGSPPTTSDDLHGHPVIRLTIDSRGIKEIERLPASEGRYSSRRFDNTAFIITDTTHADGVKALFRDNQVRLELPEGHAGFQMWDMPNPPTLPPSGSQCSLVGHTTPSMRFCTIDISSITGLTFFFSGGTFSAIHAHTDAAPYARIPHESLSRRAQKFVSWIYVPITIHDKLLAIGFRAPDVASVMKRHCVLLHTELAGDVSVGPWLPGSNEIYILSNPPSTLLYDRKETAKVSVIGAFPKATTPKLGSSPIFCFPTSPRECPFTFPDASSTTNFSSAPLRDIVVAHVFHRKGLSSCRGILFAYKNGAKRALGDCRLGVDPCETYTDVRFLCTLAKTHIRPYPERDWELVRVRFSERPSEYYGDKRWTCCEMKGTIQFWFTHQECKLEVMPD